MLDNFEFLVLLSPSEIRQEVCKLMFSIGQGIDWYKVLVVGKNGKLNETIEVSALWSKAPVYTFKMFTCQFTGQGNDKCKAMNFILENSGTQQI